MGAGVLPFCLKEEKVHFLFQTVFSGRKTGFLNDFGGGSEEGESYEQTAMREFIEETETMYFSQDITTAYKSEKRVQAQLPTMAQYFIDTLKEHPDWSCRRPTKNPQNPKDWRTFFVEIPYQDVGPMNREWEEYERRGFSKRRKLMWISATEVCSIYRDAPEKLWKRVRELEHGASTIQAIMECKEGNSAT